MGTITSTKQSKLLQEGLSKYYKDDYESRECFLAGYGLYPASYAWGCNEELKKGWHAAETDKKRSK